LQAQAGGAPKPKPAPDVMILMDGEKFIGHLERSTGSSVLFKSDMAGEITVEWKNIKELHTADPFAVVPQNVKLGKHESAARIPQGKLAVADQKIEVRSPEGQPVATVPAAESAYVIDENTFEKAVMHKSGFIEDWTGSLTAGAALVEATQHNRTFTGSVNLMRTMPTEVWMERRNRTTVDFSFSSGRLTQPGTPSLKTEIFHADAERDQYFTPSVFAFVQTAFDHNYSQGLDLEQTYGSGIGWTAIKKPNSELDLKASVNYVGQSFLSADLSPDGVENQQLIGSNFAENYMHKFARGATLNEQLSIIPAWNNLDAYSAAGSVTLAIPVYKRFSVTIGTIDTFLNNPPPGFKKMSFQFTTGLTYTLQ
jgi:Protein of unknown function, DUF481